jgi:hypothetical protein
MTKSEVLAKVKAGTLPWQEASVILEAIASAFGGSISRSARHSPNGRYWTYWTAGAPCWIVALCGVPALTFSGAWRTPYATIGGFLYQRRRPYEQTRGGIPAG